MLRTIASRSLGRQGARLYSSSGYRSVRPKQYAYGVFAGTLCVAGLTLHLRDRLLPVVFCDAFPDVTQAHSRSEPASSISFPQQIQTLSQPDVALSLLGLGIRTVSFLRVKVYAVGFYIDPSALGSLASNETASQLGTDRQVLSGIEQLIDRSVACGVRIVPTRNTDFGHLRDGFARALTARQKAASKAGVLTEQDQERISNSVQTFKGFFPSAAVPKGKELLLIKTSAGRLSVEYDGRVLGQLEDAWIAREMMMAYFASENVISAPLKTDVAQGLEKFSM